MRLSISGTACQGKSTLINDFLERWDMYESPKETYRDKLATDKHSKSTTPENQWSILDFMLEQLQEFRKGDHVIFDRCPLDNIVYSLWATDKGIEGFDDKFIDKCIPLVRESMKFIDIMFFIPITKAAPVEIENDGVRETDQEYINEIDNIFKAMYQQWLSPDSRFFPHDDKPAIIEIFGGREERLKMIQLYLDDDSGDMLEGGSILDINEIEKIESQFRNVDEGYTDTNDIKKFLI
jgi:hypothetical protein